MAILLNGFSVQDENMENDNNLSMNTRKSERMSRAIEKVKNDFPEESKTFGKRESVATQVYKEHPCRMSFFIFYQGNWLRKTCTKITQFDHIILCLIILSSIKLVIDTFLINFDENSVELTVSFWLDLGFTSLFTVELIAKAVAFGFIFDKETYLRDSWNQIDFTIVVISWLDIFLASGSIQSLKVIRTLRTLRPLRVISHNSSMKIIVKALINSLIAMLNVVVIVLIIWFMFAILGVSLFGGKFYHCENPLIDTEDTCLEYGYSWVNSDANFDNVLQAMVSLYIVSLLDGWPEIMYSAVDSTDVGHAGVRNSNPAAAYYFVGFILVGVFFFANLFIGVLFELFQEAKLQEVTFSHVLLTVEQRRWVEMQKLICKAKPKLDISRAAEMGLRKHFHKLATSTYFDIFIFISIFLNIIQMSSLYDEAGEDYVFTLEMLNLLFTIIFSLEAVIKIVGLGLFTYFYDNWNKFDFFVVSISLLDVVFEYAGGKDLKILSIGPQIARILRVIRVVKFVRLVKSLKDFQVLLQTIQYSILSLVNVLSLLLLIYFIYAILGVFLFHTVETGKTINSTYNFQDFISAILTLFRISTGEEWYLFMYDCMPASRFAAYSYFISFTMTTSFVILNVFIMVTIQALEDHYDNPDSPLDIFNKSLLEFNVAWARYSYLHKGTKILNSTLPDLLCELNHPLGTKGKFSVNHTKLMFSLNIPVDGERYIKYHDTLFSLFKRVFGKELKSQRRNTISAQIVEAEEAKTLNRIRKRGLSRLHIFYQDSRGDFFAQNSSNICSDLVTMKKVLNAWKKTITKKPVTETIQVANSESLDFVRLT